MDEKVFEKTEDVDEETKLAFGEEFSLNREERESIKLVKKPPRETTLHVIWMSNGQQVYAPKQL